ncbi:MAG: tRNA pseudouridine(13) synthase TruD [Caldilineae bacterium]|nr:MAG: tRNA pseudouridine(13) synthase TruD [Caldilineae bacterium]
MLGTCPVTEAQWRRHRVEGNRRSGCVFLGEVDIRPHPQGLTLSFFLPKGAYATVLLRELIKPGSAGPEQAESFDDVMSGLPE